MTGFRKAKCSRQTAQHKEMASDQASVCIKKKDGEWKYQKISVVCELVCRFPDVQSSSQEQSSLGNYNREKRVCTVSENQWATSEMKQDGEKSGQF